MSKALLYIHGKGGNAKESEQFERYCAGYDVYGVDLNELTPWGAEKPIQNAFAQLQKKHASVSILANSLGAYFAMLALQKQAVKEAFFISPILDMEKLILDMMTWAHVTEQELSEKKEIATEFGETLSWEYLSYVRHHPIQWDIPTEILYAERDHMTSRETVDTFVKTHHASLTVMPGGEHWFHTPEQLEFLGEWLTRVSRQHHV